MKTLRDIMRPGFLVTVQRSATVTDAVHAMAAHNVGIVAVLEGDKLAGVFSERDLVRRVVDRGLDPRQTPVSDVMTVDIIVAVSKCCSWSIDAGTRQKRHAHLHAHANEASGVGAHSRRHDRGGCTAMLQLPRLGAGDVVCRLPSHVVKSQLAHIAQTACVQKCLYKL